MGALPRPTAQDDASGPLGREALSPPLLVSRLDARVKGMRLRAALPQDAALLSDLALRSKAHWGYDEDFLEACRAELTLRPDDVAASHVTVARLDSTIVGFYSLTGERPDGELAMLYVDPDHIGVGVGQRLWQHAADTARELGFTRFTVDADPSAEGFYRRMGAVRIGSSPSGSIPGRLLPCLEYRLH